MNKTLYFNESSFNDSINKINAAAVLLQNLLNEVSNLNLFKINGIEDLTGIVNDPEAYVKFKVGESLEPKMFGIFKMKKSAMVDALDLPDLTNVIQLAAACKDIAFYGYFRIAGNKVVVDKNSIDEIRDSLSIYADTDQKVKLLESHKAAAEALSVFNKSLSAFDMHMEPSDIISTFFYLSNKDVSIKSELYLNHRNIFLK